MLTINVFGDMTIASHEVEPRYLQRLKKLEIHRPRLLDMARASLMI